MQKQTNRVLFICLDAFQATGGVQKFNRAMMKGLGDTLEDDFLAVSLYDHSPDTRYIPARQYQCFNYQRLKFIFFCLRQAVRYDTLLVGHIKLGPLAWLIKLLNPQQRQLLVAHGIEVWRPLNFLQRQFLEAADEVLCVSRYTADQIKELHGVWENRIRIFPNTLDPYFNFPQSFEKPSYLMERYGLRAEHKVVLTLARLSHTEAFKGYDLVLDAIADLKDEIPQIKYILAGKADDAEKARLLLRINALNLQEQVILTGFVKEEEVTDHYLVADVFALPSKKEGFGIVFIEAMACGLPVIAGNQDGSVDALKEGELGTLVEPDKEALIKAFRENIAQPYMDSKQLSEKVQEYFGFDAFQSRIQRVFNSILTMKRIVYH